MIGLLRIVLAGVCALSLVATGCRSNAPAPMPDALRASGLSLTAVQSSLTIRPTGSGLIEFQLHDEQDQPVAAYPIDFSIVGQAGQVLDGGVVQAELSSDRSLTDHNGSTVLQVITDGLDKDVSTAEFFVQAASEGADPALVYVRVTTDAYSVQVIPVAAEGATARTRVYFYDHTACSAIDPTNLASAPTRPRALPDVDSSGAWSYSGVSGQGSHAVLGLGFDANNAVRLAGCLDLPGSSLLANQTISVILLLDQVLPIPTGAYAVGSDINLTAPVPQPVATIASTWQEWTRCPMDPVRLWLDCTIDALNSSDPDDCVPVSGGEGSLGGILTARRGITVSSGSSIKGPTDCHDSVDSNGLASLEAVVDALFSTSRTTLAGLALGTLPGEIGSLLSAIHLDSTMRISVGGQPNGYLVDHDLVDLGFPNATPPLGFSITDLALPVAYAHGMVPTYHLGQLSLPKHGFTLRLGTAAKYAFEADSLQNARSQPDVGALVDTVFALATLSDKGNLLTGCDALDAAVCDLVKSPRGCVLGACHAGLQTLVGKLSNSFANLDGDGLDFYFLSGSAPVLDSDGDGHADALGMLRSSTASVRSGLWAAEIQSSQATTSVNGLWSGALVP